MSVKVWPHEVNMDDYFELLSTSENQEELWYLNNRMKY